MTARMNQTAKLYSIIANDDHKKLEVLMGRGVIEPSHSNMTTAITRFASARIIAVLLRYGTPLDGRGRTALASTLDPLAHYVVSYHQTNDARKRSKHMEVIEVLLSHGASISESLEMLELLQVPDDDDLIRALRNPPSPTSSPLSPASSVTSSGST